jgi:uncharacterized protein (DUF2252 family)
MAARQARKLSRREARMIVRIARVQVAPNLADEIVGRYRETVRPIHQRAKGLRNYYVLVDRHSGWMRLIGFRDSQEVLDAAITTLEPARERLWGGFEVTPSLEAYEVTDRI